MALYNTKWYGFCCLCTFIWVSLSFYVILFVFWFLWRLKVPNKMVQRHLLFFMQCPLVYALDINPVNGASYAPAHQYWWLDVHWDAEHKPLILLCAEAGGKLLFSLSLSFSLSFSVSLSHTTPLFFLFVSFPIIHLYLSLFYTALVGWLFCFSLLSVFSFPLNLQDVLFKI